ncbi:MAG: glutathione S-transferase family protein [Gammaproteobacteria bacterium]
MIGDKLGTKMILRGHPSCPDTGKCLQTAAEKGVDIETEVITDLNSSDFRAVSPYGIGPVLQDIDFVVYGTVAVMSYLDDKGFGPSLVPRNGVSRAIMYQWAIIATESVAPNLGDSINKDALAPLFDGLEKQVINPPRKGDFICGDFSLADIHWSSCCNLIEIGGAGDLISSRPGVAKWYDKVKSHPSTSKEKIIPFTVLPSATDIASGALNGISINS